MSADRLKEVFVQVFDGEDELLVTVAVHLLFFFWGSRSPNVVRLIRRVTLKQAVDFLSQAATVPIRLFHVMGLVVIAEGCTA